MAEIQFGNASLGHNATIICLMLRQSRDCEKGGGRPHIHNVNIPSFTQGFLVTLALG